MFFGLNKMKIKLTMATDPKNKKQNKIQTIKLKRNERK